MPGIIYTFNVVDGRTITVRKAPEVATSDYVGTLRSGERFQGEIITNTEQELWVKLIDKFPGSFAAVRYTSPGGSPKTFALTIGGSIPDPETPPENPEEPTTPEGKYDVSVFTSSKKIVVTSDQDLSQYVVIVNDKMFGDVAEG